MGSKKSIFSHLAKVQLHQTLYLNFTIPFFNIFLLFHNSQNTLFSHFIPLPHCSHRIFPFFFFFPPPPTYHFFFLTTHVPPPFLFSFHFVPLSQIPHFLSFFLFSFFLFPFQFVPLPQIPHFLSFFFLFQFVPLPQFGPVLSSSPSITMFLF